jgi:putative hemolysin
MSSHPPSLFDAARSLLSGVPLIPGKMEDAGPRLRNHILEAILLPKELEAAWKESTATAQGLAIFAAFLDRLGVRWSCEARDVQLIPREGPVVVVANHPFGMVEGAVLGALLSQVRPDTKFLANSLLAAFPESEGMLIPVNPFGGAAQGNSTYLRQSLKWLRKGGVLVTFPAGEVSALRWGKLEISDPEWNEAVGGLIRISGATALPVYFHGANGAAFQLAGLVHPSLRTALLPRELVNKRGAVVETSIGRPIPADTLSHLPDDRHRTDYLRQRTHLLEARKKQAPGWSFSFPKAPTAGAVSTEDLAKEVATLGPDHVLVETAEFQVCMAAAREIPSILREIGRLRELTFRQAGEGTGRSLDLDRFDARYRHLWLWNKSTREVCGAYRMGATDEIQKTTDLYTNTLFKFRAGLVESLHPALELGRSFVRPEYQKSYQALLLLWKGIGAWVARNPRYCTLFGPVSISNEYRTASRALMVSYLQEHCSHPALEGAAEPRKEFRARGPKKCDVRTLAPMLSSIDELSDAIADLEPDGKGLPVLLRQYLNLGGTVIAFNEDPRFSGVIDGLVVVDLRRLNPRLLAKYLGKPGAERFLAHQSLSPQSNGPR